MDRRDSKLLFALGLGAILASSGCQGIRRTREIPPNPPLGHEEGGVGFHSAPSPLQPNRNGPSMPGGGPASRGNISEPPTGFGGQPDGTPKTGEMSLPPGTPNP